MSHPADSVLLRVAFSALVITLLLTLPPGALAVFQIVAWLWVGLVVLGYLIAGEASAKQEARELIGAWHRGEVDPQEPFFTTRAVLGIALWAAPAAAAAFVGMPWLATAWLLVALLMVREQLHVRAFVVALDDDVKRQLAEYEEATNNPV